MSGEVAVRPATPDDAARVVELISGDPSERAVRLAGGRERAQRFAGGLVTLAGPVDGRHFLVAERAGEVVGVAQVDVDLGVSMATARLALRVYGWRLPAFLRRGRSVPRVTPKPPPGCLWLAELHVDPRHRNAGVGAALLAAVEAEAIRRGRSQVALCTDVDNPARRLYQRSDYVVAETRLDAEYERVSGSPGRLLFVKELDS